LKIISGFLATGRKSATHNIMRTPHPIETNKNNANQLQNMCESFGTSFSITHPDALFYDGSLTFPSKY